MRQFLASLVLATSTAFPASASCTTPQSLAGAEIYPTATVLPENMLRFYVYYPKPMGHGSIMDHIQLFNARGHAIDDAFLQNRLELWSPDRTRLTVILDPGRVKSGLEAHEALGRALKPGDEYTLAVRGSALASDGCEIGEDVFHVFTAGPPDLDAPEPADWTWSPITAGTRNTLEVDLGSSHDHLSMAYRLRVIDANGDFVPGSVELAKQEQVWKFVPRSAWERQSYSLRVDPEFEDLAGNRPYALFERRNDRSPKVTPAPTHIPLGSAN